MEYIYLNDEELREINGGHNGDAYEMGRLVGTILKVGSYVFPGLKALKFF